MTGEAPESRAGAAREPGPVRARERNRWGEGGRLRTEILVAAGQMLGELGAVEGLTLRGVARRVGIAPASIYAHFSDKSELIGALLEFEAHRLLDLVGRAGQAVDASDPVGRLRAKLRAFCGYALNNRGFTRVLLGLRMSEESSHINLSHTVIDELRASLEDCERAGIRLRLPAERAALVLITSAPGRVMLSYVIDDSDADIARFVDELVSLLIAS
ncbi:TetR/AcrR family transcriptional regulator [Nonomuraea sp. B19D2]|uniref:TetR/AcrR family transcriptional regulator n=1 Tax=Nonomuraea sp. B19D2 TaxID=3159561 RepID=UPI0032DBBDA3